MGTRVVFKGVRLTSFLPSRPADGGRASYVLSLGALALALGLALHAVYSFFFVSLRRLRYPYELEWMEGGMLGHALRILEGKPLYPEPSPDFVPFIYGPLYSYAGALSAAIFGPSLFSLRLISFVSTLAVLVFLYRIVAYETSSWRFGAIAPCLYLATFGASGGWFDLARIDSLSLAWLCAAIDTVRRAERARQLALAGALLACAVLTKQTCAVVFPALAWYAFTTARWRGLVAFAGSCAALGIVWSVYELVRSRGWFLYYTVELPLLHGTKNRENLLKDFWRVELVTALPIASGVALLSGLLLPRLPRPRALAFHVAVAASLILGSYFQRIHMGSYLNDLMPAHAALALLLPLGLFALGGGSVGDKRSTWLATVGIALAAQFAVLAYAPRDHAVKRGSRKAGDALVAELRKEPGDVLVVYHPHLAVLAGKPAYVHQMAVIDIFGANDDERGVREKLRRQFRQLFEKRRFSKVILDEHGFIFKPELEAFYRRTKDVALPGQALMPVTGGLVRPELVYVVKEKSESN